MGHQQEFHPVVKGADFLCEFADNMRMVTVEYEGEHMVCIEFILSSGQIIAYPISQASARKMASGLLEAANFAAQCER